MTSWRLSCVDEVRVAPAGTITVQVDPRPVRLPDDLQRRVDAHWREAVREKGSLVRGLVYTVSEVEGDASALRVVLRATDFAHYLYTQRAKLLGADACRVLHAAGLIVTSDGCLVFGEMGRTTAHAGRLQCTAGGLDARDVGADGAVDLDGSLRRGVREETGLNLDDAELVQSWQRWLLKSGGPSSSLVMVYGIMVRVRAEELLALYRRHVQALAKRGLQPEFAELVSLRADKAAVEGFLATDRRPRGPSPDLLALQLLTRTARWLSYERYARPRPSRAAA